MNRRNIFRFLAAILACVPALNASANGFRLASQDAFATARGEAFVATADNPSAIYYNPAGITQLEGNNFRAGVYGIYLDPSFSPPNGGNTYHSSDNLAAAPQFFYSHTFTNSPLSLGLGVYAPYGGSIDWPDDTGFRTVATKGKLTYLTLNPAVALKLLPSLSVGAGLMVNYAKMETEQGLASYYPPPSTRANFFHFIGDGWSVGYNLGLFWRPVENISFGATFRSSAKNTFKGHTDFEWLSAHIADTTLPAQMDLTFPLDAVFGVSYRPTPKWNLEFDADYTDWSSFGTTTIYQGGTAPLGVKQNVPVNLGWQASWMFEFGATRYFDNGWHVSAGYVFNENSVPNTYYSPLAADLDRHFFSVGAGHKGKRFDCDITYQFGYGPAHDVTGSTPSSAPSLFANPNPHPADGAYRFISSAVLVTAGLHF